MNLKCYRFTDNKILEPISPEGLSPEWVNDEVHRWLDVEDPEIEELKQLLAPLGLHPLVLESCLKPGHGSLFEAYEKALYIEFPTQTAWNEGYPPYLSIICLPTTLITIHRGAILDIATVVTNLTGYTRLRASSTSVLLYYIITHLIRNNILFCFEVRNQVDKLANLIYEDAGSIDVEETLTLTRKADQLISTFEDQLYCLTSLQIVESEAFSIDGLREYFQDAIRGMERILLLINRLETRLKDFYQHYQLKLQDKTNSRLRILTIISAVFLPLTLIAGIYGMNFNYMPGLEWRYAYPIALGFMIMLAIGMLLLFYRRGWFK